MTHQATRMRGALAGITAAATMVLGLGVPAAHAAAVPVNATTASDWSGDGRSDIVGPTSDGRLWLYRGDGAGRFSGRSSIGTGWNALDQIRMVGDFDGVPGTDIIARVSSTGELRLYPGDGAGGFRAARVIGSGWQGFSQIFSPGDWDGDGHPDLLAIAKGDGSLRLYRGDGAGRFLGHQVIGTGWARLDGLMTTGDFDGDSAPDFLARNTGNGQLLLYRSNGSGGFATTKVVGTGWNAFDGLLGVGDFNGDSHSDVVARLKDGTLRLYRGNGAGGWISPYQALGTGWNTIRFPGEGAPAATGSVCTKPIFTTSDPNGGISNGGYYVHNNLWNASRYPGTKGTTQVCSYHSWNHIGTASNTNHDGGVKTYPNVHKDYSGRSIASFSKLTSTYAATAPGVGIYNVAYDLWLNGVPNDEVMIWTDNHNQVPGGSRFASNVSLGGRAWDVYATSGNGYIAFVPSGGARYASGTVDIKAMLTYLVGKGRRASSDTVDQIGYGVEIVDTGGKAATWKFTNFSISAS